MVGKGNVLKAQGKHSGVLLFSGCGLYFRASVKPRNYLGRQRKLNKKGIRRSLATFILDEASYPKDRSVGVLLLVIRS